MAAGGVIEIAVVPDLKNFGTKLEAGMRGAATSASKFGSLLSTAIGGGAIAAGVGLAAVVKTGNDFSSTLSRIQATSGASASAMQQVSARARELGSDASLAGTSSLDAAQAIEELAKAGLSVSDSMKVARDAIVLSRAGMLDGGAAASLLANAINTYGLTAADATRVTDVFAAAANASTTDVRDLGESLKYVGPVAAGLKISFEDSATALALLSTAGIKGSEAGTALRGMLASLAAPSKPAAAALETLGIKAFDATGRFVGLESITRQLTAAKSRMTDQEFQAAAAVSFGNEGLGAANVLATQGVGKFQELGTAVREQGAAQKAAAANSQGLAGAMDQLEGNAQDLALSIYDLIKGPLTQLAQAGSTGLGGLSDLLSGKSVNAGPLTAALSKVQQVFTNLRVAAEPVASGIKSVVTSLSDGGKVGLFTGALTGLAGAVELLSRILGPVGSLVGGLLKGFAALPGPIQTAIIAFAGFKLVSSYLNSASGATSRLASVVNAIKPTGLMHFNSEARVQRELAAAAGQSVSRWGSYVAAFNTSTLSGVTALRNFRDQTVAIRDGAAAAGTPINTLSAGIRTLAERSPSVAAIATSFTTARTAISNFGQGVADSSTRFGGLISGATRATSVVGGLGTALVTTTRVGFSGLLGALGGPWGALLTAAAVAVSIFGQKNAEAAQQEQQHKAALDNLRGSLNQVTGAATDATRAIQAQELTNTKLADGTTSLSTALARLGIDTKTWVDATTGNQGALEGLNATLHKQAVTVLQGSDVWKTWGGRLSEAGVTIDQVADAAIGNEQALRAMAKAFGNNDSTSLDYWRKQLRGAVGDLGEVGALLGASAGDFADMSKAQREAAAASATFGDALKLLGENHAFETLKDGATATAPVIQMLSDLTAAAGKSAQQAGQDALKFTGSVEAGAASARDSMQKSRDAFVEQAAAALGSKEAAEALATQIGLIPSAAETIFRTNATGVAAELITLNAQIDAVPKGKDVIIRSITKEAEAQLTTFDFKVEHLKDGTVKITAPTDEANKQLDDFIAGIGSKEGKVPITGDTAPLQGQVLNGVAFANGQTGTLKIDGDPALVNGKIETAVTFADGSKGTLILDGNEQPVNGKIQASVRYADGSVGRITVDANNNPALQKIRDAIAAATRTVTLTVNATVNQFTNLFKKDGGIVSAQHEGGILGFAGGGVAGRRLSPMRAGIAQIVAPNTWRVIGDRIRDDEAYVPINQSPRSLAILEETARRMGFSLARNYADGGIADRMRAQLVSSIRTRVNGSSVATFSEAQIERIISGLGDRGVSITQNVVNPVAERASATLTRELRTLSAMGAFGT